MRNLGRALICVRPGCSAGYAETLATGLWPSLDALPAAEKDRRGKPIRLEEMLC